jgi:hypothetical protein
MNGHSFIQTNYSTQVRVRPRHLDKGAIGAIALVNFRSVLLSGHFATLLLQIPTIISCSPSGDTAGRGEDGPRCVGGDVGGDDDAVWREKRLGGFARGDTREPRSLARVIVGSGSGRARGGDGSDRPPGLDHFEPLVFHENGR